MNKVLVELIANLASFLEFSDESDVRLDVAVRQLEEIGFRLQKLPREDALEFSRIIREIAMTREDAKVRTFLEEFPRDFGLE
jgi:hypothetical protein